MPYEALRLVWRNHTQPSISADFTHYEEFLRAVRTANAASGGRRLRVLLGDPPIDWDAIQRKDEHLKWIEMRDAYPAAVLQTEVIAKQRRALLVYGTAHLQRSIVMSIFEMDDWRSQTVVSLVERAGPTRVFTIAGLDKNAVTGWRPQPWRSYEARGWGRLMPPHISARSSGSPFGTEKFFRSPQSSSASCAPNRSSMRYCTSVHARHSPNRCPQRLCSEPGYVDMRLKRIALAGLPPPEVERVKKLCPDQTR